MPQDSQVRLPWAVSQTRFATEAFSPDEAGQRFEGDAGKVHVYGDNAATIERSIGIDGRGQVLRMGGD